MGKNEIYQGGKMMPVNQFEMFEEMPLGWRVDKTWGSPLHGWIPICNGKSVINGGRKGLARLKFVAEEIKYALNPENSEPYQQKEKKTISIEDARIAAKTSNILAREKFKEKLLQELLFDLNVCKIEGWNTKEYVEDLKSLIDDVHKSIANPANGKGAA